jgi:CheY-like chemotaxis protein
MPHGLILVVDDDPDTRELYKLVFETADYRVAAAGSIADGISLADRLRPDVILTDWRLDDGDGFAFCAALHRRGRTRRIPIIAATGVSLSEEAIARVRQLGCDPVLTKPIDLDRLVRVTASALDRSRSRILKAAATRIRRYASHARLDATVQQEDRRISAARLLAAARQHGRPDVALIIADDHGRYLAANEEAARITGYDAQELTSLSVADLTGTPQPAGTAELWNEFIAERAQEGLFMVKRRSGESIAVRYVAIAHVVPGLHLSALSPAVLMSDAFAD